MYIYNWYHSVRKCKERSGMHTGINMQMILTSQDMVLSTIH